MSMFSMTLFLDYCFDTPDKANSFFQFLNESEEPFAPVRYDKAEPIRKVFDAQLMGEPTRLLVGEPHHQGGGILFKGAKYKSLATIGWSVEYGSDITWYLDQQFFAKKGKSNELVHFIANLSDRYPLIFGYGAATEDWEATHRKVIESPDGTISDIKVQTDLEHCLPGIYWMTLFGPALTSHFGRDTLLSLPVSHTLELGNNGVGIFLDKTTPFAMSQPDRLAQGAAIAARLGRQYFFDSDDVGKVCEAIPGVTPGGPPSPAVLSSLEQAARRVVSPQRHPGVETAEELERREVLDHEGPVGEPRVSQTDPETLAEDLVVYLHEDVRAVFEASRATLVALDTYFTDRPPTREYKPEFLLNDFVPRLGAFLGRVLIEQGGGEWSVRRPVMTSRVVAGTTEIDPFWLAFRATYDHSSLVDAYDRALASINK